MLLLLFLSKFLYNLKISENLFYFHYSNPILNCMPAFAKINFIIIIFFDFLLQRRAKLLLIARIEMS